jgi:hypothetical protein
VPDIFGFPLPRLKVRDTRGRERKVGRLPRFTLLIRTPARIGALIAISTFIRAEAAARFDCFFLTRAATPSDVVMATSSQWQQPERISA